MILYVWKYEEGAFNKVAVIDNATSIIWVTRFNKAGQFELYIQATQDLLNLFRVNLVYDTETLISRDDDERAMIVENIKLTTDAKNGDYLTITGRSAECLLERRIIPQQTNYQTTAELAIRKMLNDNLVNPVDSWRKMDLISLGQYNSWTEAINKQVTGKNLLDTISEICVAYSYGFKLLFSNGKFVFELYKGVDHSYLQAWENYVVFSPDFENLGNTEYTQDTTTYYNTVYVAGEGEGADRTIIDVSVTTGSGYGVSGLGLREKWLDARQTSSTTGTGHMDHVLYGQMLREQGKEELVASSKTEKFSGQTLDINVFKYGVDYGLGDTVQIVNEYGIEGMAVVTEVTEVEDENGYRLYPTLSEWKIVTISNNNDGIVTG